MAAPLGRAAAGGSSAPLPSGSGSAGRGALLASAAAAEEEGSEGGASGSGSLPGSARQCSAPMSIPGRGALGGCGGGGQGRRLRSSNDLWALQHAAAMRKPLSAPAVSHMQHAAGSSQAAAAESGSQAAGPRGSSGAEAPPSPSPPTARLPLIPGTLDSESSGSAASSLYPTSCSPQLPFAFTPSAQSVSSFGARGPLESAARLDRISPRPRTGHLHAPSSGGGGGGGGGGGPSVPHQAATAALAAQQAAQRGMVAGSHGAATSGGTPGSGFSPSSGGSVAGREVPASTALMRRPSWSSRSYGPLAGEASSQGVGYSGGALLLLSLGSRARDAVGACCCPGAQGSWDAPGRRATSPSGW